MGLIIEAVSQEPEGRNTWLHMGVDVWLDEISLCSYSSVATENVERSCKHYAHANFTFSQPTCAMCIYFIQQHAPTLWRESLCRA